MKLKSTISIFIIVLLVFAIVIFTLFFGGGKLANKNNKSQSDFSKTLDNIGQQKQTNAIEQVVQSLSSMQAEEKKDPDLIKKQQAVVDSLKNMQAEEKKDPDLVKKQQTVKTALDEMQKNITK